MNHRLLPVFLLFPILVACQPGPSPSGTAIKNVTIIDAVNGVREQRTVVFDGDEITAVLPADAEFTAARTIDGTGKYLVPGLWDFHVHLSYDDRFGDSMPALFLSWGITSVRDTGGLMRKMQPIVERMRADGAVSPRVFYAGPLLDGEFVVYDGESRPEIGVRNATPEQARQTVRRLHEQGVDFIKIYELVSPDVFAAMVGTANELGLPIDSHVPLSMRASVAGPPVDSMEHLRNIELDCAANAAALHETRLEKLNNPDDLPGYDLRASLHELQRLPAIASHDEQRCADVLEALSSTLQVPTLRLVAYQLYPPYTRDDWDEALARLPAAVREPWQDYTGESRADPPQDVDLTFGQWGLDMTGWAHDAGVPIGAGTDVPIAYAIPGYSLHAELELLVRAGLTPLEVLESATVWPARFFSLEDEMGTIDIGKRADLVLLDANPLDDITNTKKISQVVSKGSVFSVAELETLAAAD